MGRSTRSQKVERLNAAYTLLAQGATASEAMTQLSQRFGLSQRHTNGLCLEPMGPFSCSDRGDTFWL